MKLTLKKLSALLLVAVLCLSVFAGCTPSETVTEDPVIVDTKTAVLQCMSEVTSVESNITLEMKAHIGSQGSTDAHSATVGSDITIQMTAEPLAVHAEYYSRVLVDGVATRDDKEYYIIEEGEEMGKYNYVSDSDDEWEHTTLTKAEALAVPCQTGLIYDWNQFLTYLNDENYTESVNGKNCYRFSGNVPASILQEFFGENVFGTMMYSTEMLLSDLIPCVLYIDSTTYYPEQVNLTFTNNFIVSDMVFDNAVVTCDYSEWNAVPEISIPKKVEVVASNPDAEFYSTFYAWNLFLPYIENKDVEQKPQGNEGLSFTADWSTFQVRIDGGMTKLPILYSDLEKLNYYLDAIYSSTIIEANKFMTDVPVKKGSDTLYCTFYNPDVNPQPINNCYIGAIDLSAGNNPNAGIQVYLPGEVSLGVTRDALVSAYGDPDLIEQAFASDTYTWYGVDENQGFLAEVSPVNNQVIRIYLKNIPVTGGQQ